MKKIVVFLLLAAFVSACVDARPTGGLAGRMLSFGGSAYPTEGPDYSADKLAE